jgi:surfactin synthase thioesterase subunit
VQLPGRANRLREPALTSIRSIVDSLVPVLAPLLDLPFAFFGHSMGAVVASETTRALSTAGANLPQHLFVSSRRPPHVPDKAPPLHLLSDDAFVSEINRRYGGIPPEVAAQADVLALLLPGLRADIRALETYEPECTVPLPCPISAFGGTHDPLTPHEHLEAWRSVTQSTFRVQLFAGDHFYLESRRADVLADLCASWAASLGPESGSQGAA